MRTITLLLFLLLTQFSLSAQVFWLTFDWNNSNLPHINCHNVYVDDNDQVYAATSGGVGVYNGSWSANSLTTTGVLPNFLAATQPDEDGVLWAGAFQNGIARYENGTWTKEYQANIKNMLVDSINQKWFASTDGLVLYDGMNFSEIRNDNTPFFPSNIVNTVTEDGQGNIWVGCDPQGNLQGGLARFDGNSWTSWNTTSGLPDNRVNSIAFMSNGDMLLATDAGLAIGDPLGGWTTYTVSNSMLPNDQVNVVKVDDADLIWIGTEGGLATFDLLTMGVFTTANSDIPDNRVRGIDFDGTGHTWLASGGGITAYNPNGVTTNLDNLSNVFVSQPWSPNPVSAGELVSSRVSVQQAGPAIISLLSLEGKVLLQEERDLFVGEQSLALEITGVSAGMYLVQIQTSAGRLTQKIQVR